MDEAPFFLSLLIPGVAIPATVAAAALVFACRLVTTPGEQSDRVAGAAAMACGFFAGYAAFPWTPWRPQDSWDWLPYLVALTVLADSIAARTSLSMKAGAGLRASALILCAWLLVPTLPDLEATRFSWIVRAAVPMG